ncbi:MAG: response regulator, partial [Verrucomicrobiota bacterium]
CRILEKAGYHYDIAENGAEGVKAIERRPYDLVLMDCQMPVMSGFDATKMIRLQDNDRSKVPIVGMTAMAMQGDREKCLGAGMDDYLTKPVTPEKLLDMLRKWLLGKESVCADTMPKRKKVEDEDADPSVQTAIELAKRFNMDQFKNMTGADDEFMKEVATDFLEDGEKQVEQIKQFTDEKNLEKIGQNAHALKGVSANLGAEALSDLAHHIELHATRNKDLAGVESALDELEEEWDQVKDYLKENIL